MQGACAGWAQASYWPLLPAPHPPWASSPLACLTLTPTPPPATHPSPQAPFRLLTHADVGVGLIGMHAELFWPDDNLWYLIRIQVGVAGVGTRLERVGWVGGMWDGMGWLVAQVGQTS